MPRKTGSNKLKFMEREMEQMGFSEYMKNLVRERLTEGLEIMTKAEITRTLEDYNNEIGGY